MPDQRQDDQYSEAEADQRFKAALRGAMNKSRTQMKDIPRKARARLGKASQSQKGGKASENQ